MRFRHFFLATALVAIGAAAHAGNQSSNTSSNSSSNNGVVRERVVDRYCEDGYCTRTVSRRVYRDDDGRRYRGDGRRYRYRDYDHYDD